MIWPIEGVVKDYAWGRPGALSDVLGRRVSDGVEAEWWLGAHPLGPSRAFDDHTPIALLLASQGAPALGFLFKILTPGSPLSLQVHPSPAQARAGFDRENDQGIPRDAPGRHYKDPFAKPELVVAWGGPFHALAGIRPLHEIRAVLSDLEDGGVDPMLLSRWRTSLDRGVSSAVAWLLGGGPEVAALLDELGRHRDRVEILERLWRHYPSDPGVAVALMMNRITLEPGESLFLDAGQLHAYLEGTAIELMAPSDNVLRGGLTQKTVDVDELLRIATCEPVAPPYLPAVDHGNGWREWAPHGQPFALHAFEAGKSSHQVDLRGPSIALALLDEAVISEGTNRVVVAPGTAVLVSGASSLEVERVNGQLWVATAG